MGEPDVIVARAAPEASEKAGQVKYANDEMSLESPAHSTKGKFHVVEEAAPFSGAEKAGTALVAAAMLIALLAVIGVTGQEASAASAPAPDVSFHAAATLTGPITTGQVVEPLTAHTLDLAANGYVQQEFFATGTATAFMADSMPSDGKWTVTPTTTAPYPDPGFWYDDQRTPPSSTERWWSSG